ncbi:ribonuclease P protein component [Demequina gelatinilytica]|uniref:ribonuclease P protein component n=1 Tax=Demequina gelatinilytica TaxID=1638980 RepID=UPI000782C5A8|nr:ribonuclease P protein component [Demequina gelatinilytica]
MLPADARLRSSAEFRSAMRSGIRSGRRTVVVHVALTGDARRMAGFAVSKAVGGAVTRNRVKRRLRAVMQSRLSALPEGTSVVLRALPPAADASFATLEGDVDGALRHAMSKVGR